MLSTGILKKMQSRYASPIVYELHLGDSPLNMNELLGSTLELEHNGQIYCLHCSKAISKTYQQGYCYPCFISLAQCDMCMLKPELCHYARGTCREPQWGEKHCMTDHWVYLSNTSGLKVGISRHSNIPTRWIDQGAGQATRMYRVKTRLQAGLIEVLLADVVPDKTNWRQMLKADASPIDLIQEKRRLHAYMEKTLEALSAKHGEGFYAFQDDNEICTLNYPILAYPPSLKSYTLEKGSPIRDRLIGIKGQYLLFEAGVINLRKYGGYHLEIRHSKAAIAPSPKDQISLF